MIGEVLLLVGAAFILLAAFGILRFDDVFVRMQILSKASTFGLLVVILGGVVGMSLANDITSLVLAAALHLITSGVGSNLLTRATYFAEGIGHGLQTVDELAEADRRRSPGS